MVAVCDLLYRGLNFNSTVYAGSNGLHKNVRAVSVVDAPDSISFLTGGELILTTGFQFKDSSEDMYCFIEGLINGKAAGLAVQMGIYLHEFPDIVVELANEHNFPIFSIPNDIGWSNIITRFHDLRAEINQSVIHADTALYNLISLQDQLEQNRKEQHEQLISAVVNDEKEEKLKMLAGALEFYGSQYYCMAVVYGKNPDRVCRMLRRRIKDNTGFMESELSYILTDYNHEAIVLLNIGADKINGQKILSCLGRICKMFAEQYSKCRIYWGNVCQSIDEINNSYIQANRAREVADRLSDEAPVVFYSDIDAIDLLSGAPLNFDDLYILEKKDAQLLVQLEKALSSGNEILIADMQTALSKLGIMMHNNLSQPINRLNMMMKLRLLRMQPQRY